MTHQISPVDAMKQGMPALPDGWHYELHDCDFDVVHVVWPEHGAVSMHFKRRTLALGWMVPSAAPSSAALKSGRGWREALVADAVAMLKTAWE